MSTAAHLENPMTLGNTDARAMTPAECVALQNRVEAAYQKLAAVQPFAFAGQVQEALQAADSEFFVFLKDAADRGNEVLVGKLVMRALNLWRYREAQERVELEGEA